MRRVRKQSIKLIESVIMVGFENHDDEIVLTETQFIFALDGLNHTDENKEAMRRILVDGEALADVARNLGKTGTRLGQIKKEILESLNEKLKAHNMKYCDLVVSESDYERLKNKYETKLQNILNDNKKDKQ